MLRSSIGQANKGTCMKQSRRILFIALFVFISLSSFADQVGDFPLDNLICDQGQFSIEISKEQITRDYAVHFINFQKNKTKATLSSLAVSLKRKCFFYFFSYNPSAELFQMRLKLKQNSLQGELFLTKDNLQKKLIECRLTNSQFELLSKSCESRSFLRNAQNKKKVKEEKRVMPSARALGLEDDEIRKKGKALPQEGSAETD